MKLTYTIIFVYDAPDKWAIVIIYSSEASQCTNTPQAEANDCRWGLHGTVWSNWVKTESHRDLDERQPNF